MKEELDTSMFYNPQKLLSYNCLFNFVEGERGNGKTYGFKKIGIDNFRKKKEQFIYLRRYETELNDINIFFSDIQDRYKEKLTVTGQTFKCNDEIMGYAIPLSKAITKKSVPFDKVTMIIFDEFLIEKRNYHYLRNEVKLLLDFYETVARWRNNVRLVCISNSISEINPYHAYFDIKPSGSEFTRIKKDIILQRTNCSNYREYKKNTRFGQIIQGTDYEQYAIQNEYVNDNKEFIEKKTEKAINRFNIIYQNVTIGIWIDHVVGKVYCSSKYNKELANYCIMTEDMKPNYLILKNTSNNMKMLKNAYDFGYIYYENIKIKGYMEEVRKLLYIK